MVAAGNIIAGVITPHIAHRLNMRPMFQAGMVDPMPSTPQIAAPSIGIATTRSHQQNALASEIPTRIACICVSRNIMVV